MFKYALGQNVKVRVLGFITEGVVKLRQYRETELKYEISYEVEFTYGIYNKIDRVTPTEFWLDEAQKQPLGFIGDNA